MTLQIRSNALIKRGSLKMQNGEKDAALADFAQAVSEDAENSDIYHHQGQVKLADLWHIGRTVLSFLECIAI